MKKLRLDVDGLTVESFVTAAERRGAGTVRGAEATELCSAGPVTCHPTNDPCDTCATSCAGATWPSSTKQSSRNMTTRRRPKASASSHLKPSGQSNIHAGWYKNHVHNEPPAHNGLEVLFVGWRAVAASLHPSKAATIVVGEFETWHEHFYHGPNLSGV